MRKGFIVTAVLALSLLSLSAFAAAPEDPISQGDFAVLLIGVMNKPAPSGGWTPAGATQTLGQAGIAPQTGFWNTAAVLKEGDLAVILRRTGLNFFSTQPEAVVTWAKAEAVLGQYRDFFRAFHLHGRVPAATTTHVHTGVGGQDAAAPAPASPATP